MRSYQRCPGASRGGIGRGSGHSWQEELRRNAFRLEHLSHHLQLNSGQWRRLQQVVSRHPMSITRYYLSLIDWDDPADPLRRMMVPSEEELSLAGSYDTSGELENTVMPGLQHKYPQTALILATNRCASYCRFCFRKRLVGLSTQEVLHRFGRAVSYIRRHGEINNVLISGGDPFVLPTAVIHRFLESLSSIEHLEFIRFGTRLLATLPQRVLEDGRLVEILNSYSRPERRIYVVTHFNHPREITPLAAQAIDYLLQAGVVLSNQAVLLKGVNDDPQVLATLMRRLVSVGVTPYYLFQCRPVKRAKHRFQVSLRRGCHVVEEAKAMLDGHAKRFKYVMAHRTGKIEILGVMDRAIYLKYHQAKDPRRRGRMFHRRLSEEEGWLDERTVASV